MLHQIAARENHEQTAVDYSQVCTASELDCFKQSSFQAPFDVGRGCHERSRWECLAVTIFCHALLRLPLVRLKKFAMAIPSPPQARGETPAHEPAGSGATKIAAASGYNNFNCEFVFVHRDRVQRHQICYQPFADL